MAKPFEVGKTYKTRDGRDARVICTDRENNTPYKVIALVNGVYGNYGEAVLSYTPEGLNSAGIPFSDSDLIPEKEKIEGWVRVLHTRDGLAFGDVVYATKYGALNSGEALVAIKIEYEG